MENELIPTYCKDKLPKDLSYPLGAQEISRALTGIPQHDELKLWFRSSPMDSKSEFHDLLLKGLERPILKAWYFCHPMTISGPGFVSWTLLIYPVLRKKRHIAHELLCKDGLASARKWLSTPRPDTWRSGEHSLTVTFDGSNETIRIQE
jgi:hypothetical protein